MPSRPAARRLAAKMDRARTRDERHYIKAYRPVAQDITTAVVEAFAVGAETHGIASAILDDFTFPLAEAQIAGYILGHQHSMDQVRAAYPTMELARVPIFRDAVGFLKGRAGMDEIEAARIASHYGNEATRVMRGVKPAVERAAQTAVQETVGRGLHVTAGRKVLRRKLAAAGMGSVKPYLLETLVRTQMAIAYSAGRQHANSDPAIAEILWGYEYVTVGDDRVRDNHRELDGLRLAEDDPRWNDLATPNGFNCRCAMITIFKNQRAARTKSDMLGGDSIAGPDPGWSWNPANIHPNMQLPTGGVKPKPKPKPKHEMTRDEFLGDGITVFKGLPKTDWRTGKRIIDIDARKIRSKDFFPKGKRFSGYYSTDRKVAQRFADLLPNSHVVEARVKMRNPLIVDAKGKPANEFMTDALNKSDNNKAIMRALDTGDYDGLIIKNTLDEGDIYAPLSSKQVKIDFQHRALVEAAHAAGKDVGAANLAEYGLKAKTRRIVPKPKPKPPPPPPPPVVTETVYDYKTRTVQPGNNNGFDAFPREYIDDLMLKVDQELTLTLAEEEIILVATAPQGSTVRVYMKAGAGDFGVPRFAGAVSYADDGTHIYIEHMGSVRARTGTAMLGDIFDLAVRKGRGIRGVSTPGAKGFYKKMGISLADAAAGLTHEQTLRAANEIRRARGLRGLKRPR